jgi:tRNA-2-methylthio-N6-dimethylallyladenosine synthase
VGFPGESAADFRETLRVVDEVAFVDGYSFKYSPRPETAAAADPDRVDPDVAQERLAELQERLRALTLAAHRARVGGSTQILIEGESRRGGQVMGRDPWHRVVNATAGAASPQPGQVTPVRIVEATPHSLIGQLEVKETLEIADETETEECGPRGAGSPTGTFPL